MGEGMSKIELAVGRCLTSCANSAAPFATASKFIDELCADGWTASELVALRDRVVKELLGRHDADLTASN